MTANIYQIPQKIFPLFDLGDIILRQQEDYDAENFFDYYTSEEVCKYILCEMPQTVEDARRELQYWRGVFYQNDGAYFAIADKETNKMIGSIGITSYNAYQSRIELSYDLAREYWRRGITTRAVDRIVRHAFEDWKVNRIEASVSTSNAASKNLLLKFGFTLEGILRQHRYHRGQYVDVYFFSLLKSDFYKHHPIEFE
jgi:ribosomal-protein-alanine N-acetyltransferase